VFESAADPTVGTPADLALAPPESAAPAEPTSPPAEPTSPPTDPAADASFTAGPEPQPADAPADSAEPLGSFGEPSALQGTPGADVPGLQAEVPPEDRPTWGDLSAQSAERRAMQYPASTRRLPPADPAVAARAPEAAEPRRGPLGRLGRKGEEDAGVMAVSCNFDERRNRLVDFALPDVQGRPVRFQDLDADFILIDFWGTWCGPCVNAIPHLVEVQNRYDPKRVRVVGVACEQGTPEENTASVVAAMRQLGVNYPVLMSGQDGRPCPLSAAFKVQAYPTLVLVDRHGRVLWRDTGGGPATLTRLDRVLAANLRAGVVRR
jgi:thiol-disulfide isomerase/thioredoxin